MTTDHSAPPDPAEAGTVTEFVLTLARLRLWAGEPSLSRLRMLGGRAEAPDGNLVDRLPQSTVSHVLRQTGRLPRWEFVEAFVTACLRYCGHPPERIPGELERWRTARTSLTEPVPAPAPPPEEATHPSHPAPDHAVPHPAAPDRSHSDRPHPDDAQPGHAAPERAEPDHAVELLARRVAREEDRARKGLLGGYSIAPVTFGVDAGGDPEEKPAEEPADDLRSIARFFVGLSPRRLMVVGGSGVGKTVLAIELVLQLLEPHTAGGRPGLPAMVPVRLAAARWSSRRRFEPWLAEQLTRDFGLSAKDAARLVRDRRVLPVVDGLDELDPVPSAGPPRQAIELLAELNRYSDPSGRRPGAAVVTCRDDRYAELARARVSLEHATLLHLHNLSTGQITEYLHARWVDGHPCAPHRDAVLTALSGASGEAVRTALGTPWRLQLTATAIESGADPAELLRADPEGDAEAEAARITRRLIDAYVPAATELTPRTSHGTRYRPEQVRSWLTHLAVHLRHQAAQAGALDRPPAGLTGIDLVPHLLWPIGGRRLVRVLHGSCCAVLAVVAMLAFWTGSAVDRPGDLTDGLAPGEAFSLVLMAAWVCLAVALSLAPWPTAAGGRSNVRYGPRLLGSLVGALAGCAVGVAGGLAGLVVTGGEIFGPAFAVAGGAAGAGVFGAVIGLTAAGRPRSERMTVSETVRTAPGTLVGFGLCGALTGLPPLRLAHVGPPAMAAVAVVLFVLAFALGVGFRIAAGGWSEDAELAHPREALHRNPMLGVAYGLTGGVAAFLVFLINSDVLVSAACALVGGVTFGVAFGAIAWTRAVIGLAVAAARGRLPLQLWAFLDWAQEAQLLRISGPTYQFRHHELQDFLAPPPRETGAAGEKGPAVTAA
ncbi:NACHT domain-containing protein [Actinomadura sp. 9N215]|uniref:NACHT domain-containing protein n=1 Tax=Actinomadura sp. 9N215 TaxID=3375150 RepID=UPI0037B13762